MLLLLRHQLLLILAACLVFFTNLGGYALFNEDEPKNAACGAEMFRRGDWVVPTFNKELRTDKPILVYWLMLTSFNLFGISEFSARLASSFLAVGTTLLTYHLGRKLYSAEVGFLAGLILCTFLLYSAVGRAVTPDSTLVFFFTLAMTSYVWIVASKRGGNFSGFPVADAAVQSPVKAVDVLAPIAGDDAPQAGNRALVPLVPANWKLAIPMYAAMGFAVLAKGPIGVVLPCAIIGLFLLLSLRRVDLITEVIQPPAGPWWRRTFVTIAQVFRPRPFMSAIFGMQLLVGIGVVAVIALPWYVTVGIKTNGDWLRGFLFDHNVGRALGARESHDGFPLYQLYYVVVIHLCCFPWSVFLPVAVYQLRQRFVEGAAWKDSDRLVACWAGLWFVVFSLVSTKLPNYLLPMYPAVALILGRYFYDWQREDKDSGVYSFNICCRVLGAIGAIMVAGLYIAAYLLFSSEQWLGLVGIVPTLGAFLAIRFLDREQRGRVMQTLMVTAVLLAVLVVGVAPARISNYQDAPKFVSEARQAAGTTDVTIGTYGYFEPTIVYYAGGRVYPLQTAREVADFLAERPHAFVIARASKLNELREELTGDVREISKRRRFLRFDELVLLGRN